jgi:hypothetical protein
MLVEISGVRDGDLWPAKGGELTVSDAEGAELIRQGYAEGVAAPVKPEKATARKAPEKRA